jgi:hypothetical protein
VVGESTQFNGLLMKLALPKHLNCFAAHEAMKIGFANELVLRCFIGLAEYEGDIGAKDYAEEIPRLCDTRR